MASQGYTIMVSQSKIDLSPITASKPQPDMLFFKETRTTQTIEFNDALYIDAKLHISTAFTDAQKELVNITSTSKQAKIYDFATDKNAQVFSKNTSHSLEDFRNSVFTLKESGKVALSFESDLVSILYK